MPGLIAGLEVARRALLAHQAALTVTGHNISNVATPGFTRRKSILLPQEAERTPEGSLGSGVEFGGVSRSRDLFLDSQLREESGLAGKWEARSDSLGRIEILLNEPSGSGLSELLNEFWNSWLDLSNSPEDFAARTVVVQKGETLATAFRQTDTRLESVLDSSDREVEQAVAEINARLEEVGRLNSQIYSVQTSQGETADLEDRRDYLIDSLAKDSGASHLVRADGTLVVRIGNRTVVQGNDVSGLALERYAEGQHSHLRVVYAFDGVKPDDLSGRIGGLIEVREQLLPAFREQLGSLARTLVQSVNRVHEAGPSRLGFFRGNRIDNIEVVPDLALDPSKVNAGSSGDAGDNDIALSIAALRDARILANSTATPGSFYSAAVAGVGSLRQQASIIAEGQNSAVRSLEAQRQAAIGVNLDEELARLIESQRAYQSAARLFHTWDTMFDALLSI